MVKRRLIRKSRDGMLSFRECLASRERETSFKFPLSLELTKAYPSITPIHGMSSSKENLKSLNILFQSHSRSLIQIQMTRLLKEE